MADDLPLTQDRELISDFTVENREHLRAIEANLLRLERNATDADAIHGAFREFHTIKALAGFLEFRAMEEVAHQVESILDYARTGQITISAQIIDLIFQGAEYLVQWTDALEISLHSGVLPAAPEHAALSARIRAVTMPDRSGSQLELLAGAVSQRGAAASRETECEARSVRVDAARLDHLLELIGELQATIRHDPDLSQLSLIIDEVHKTAIAMRMMRVGPFFERMARVVRDLARRTGKEVEFKTSGEDTELDRGLLEHLADPLMHMLRNAIDHGIEPPEDRVALGKERAGRVELSAAYECGNVVIQVSDDGRGLDRSRILSKAVAEGLIADGANLSDAEVHRLIFQPGFSTAREINNVSGRGVGMDVVHSKIEELEGRIDIESIAGRGTTFYLKLRRAC